MTVEVYDAAQRRFAAETGRPVWRVSGALVSDSADAVAVRATTTRGRFVVGRRGGVPVARSGGEVLDALALSGVVTDRDLPPRLLVADPGTVEALTDLARAHAGADDPTRASAAEAVAWCCERADFPGSEAVVDLAAVSSVALVAGVPPSRDRSPETWRQWLGLPGDPVAATFAWAAVLASRHGGLEAALEPVRRDDVESWERRRHAVSEGWTHTRPEGMGSAAVGLRTRCDAEDLWQAALLADPWWRRRAVHTGHVVVGTARYRSGLAGFEVVSPRLDARLAAGAEVTGWSGGPEDQTFDRLHSTLRSAAVHGGRLVLVCDRCRYMPPEGEPVTVMGAPPSTQMHTSVRIRMWQKYRARGSWVARAETPTTTRRDVPLGVMIAAAEPESGA